VKKREERKIVRALNNKHARKHRMNNSMIIVYVPREINSKIKNICKAKKLKATQWVRTLIIEKLEENAQKRHNYKVKKSVNHEGKAQRKMKKKLG
jgi:hypothetical protein